MCIEFYFDSGVTAWTRTKTNILVRQVETKAKKVRRECRKLNWHWSLSLRLKLAVWNFFWVKSNSDECPSNTNRPICCKCLEPVAASYGNTSNFFNHLHCKHPLVYAQIHDKKKSKRSKKGLSSKGAVQQTIEHIFSLVQKYDRKGKKW